MEWREMHEAIADARETIDRADTIASQMAHLFIGRLRAARIDNYALCQLKRELRDYNMHTGTWKSEV